MISVIITSFNEPESTEKAVQALLEQDFIGKMEIIVSDPFESVLEYLKSKFGSKIKYDLDFGEGKSACLNRLINEVKGEIIICTDGDVYLDKSGVREIVKKFKDESVGCVCGHPISINSRDNMLGFWSQLLFDVGAHLISRKKRYEKGEILECSGYLFGFRNGVVKEFPFDVAEDTVISYLFFKRGFKIAYAEDAKVYVKNPEKFGEFVKQRKRTADAHSKLKKYYPDFPKVKSFFGEVRSGLFNIFNIFGYCNNIKEFIWIICLFFFRFYVWVSLFYDLKFKKDSYKDGWREDKKVEGTGV